MAMVHGQNKRMRASAAISPPIPRWPPCWKWLRTLLPRHLRRSPGDFIYFQGHASQVLCARLPEGRFDDERLLNFRHEIAGKPGLSSILIPG